VVHADGQGTLRLLCLSEFAADRGRQCRGRCAATARFDVGPGNDLGRHRSANRRGSPRRPPLVRRPAGSRAARLDVAPPAPGRLPADGPARFGQRSTVAPDVERVPFGTESLAHLGNSNRLMLRVLVRHGAPAPCSRSERRCLGSRRQRLLDTRSVGREFVLAYPAAERSPTRGPRATRNGPPEGRGPIRRAARRETVPRVH
jgi:hypothetical protein